MVGVPFGWDSPDGPYGFRRDHQTGDSNWVEVRYLKHPADDYWMAHGPACDQVQPFWVNLFDSSWDPFGYNARYLMGWDLEWDLGFTEEPLYEAEWRLGMAWRLFRRR
jgi:hypothetical protein